jgi:hypothetical protein
LRHTYLLCGITRLVDRLFDGRQHRVGWHRWLPGNPRHLWIERCVVGLPGFFAVAGGTDSSQSGQTVPPHAASCGQ